MRNHCTEKQVTSDNNIERKGMQMEAKQFLNQLKKLDKMIENKLAEKARWKALALGTTAQNGGERVQSSGSQQKMADAVCRYIDIEKEIDEQIDKLVDTRQEVISVIEKLKTTEYDLLHKVYVQYLSLYEVADIYGNTYSWATTVHGRALKNVQAILDGRDQDNGCKVN